MKPSKNHVLLAMGYRDDGWLSTILHAEQLHQAQVAAWQHGGGLGAAPALHAPWLGHAPKIWERRLRFGLDLPAASLLHLLDPAYADSLLIARRRCDHLVASVTDVAFWRQRTRANTWLRRRIVRGLAVADATVAISQQTAGEMQQLLAIEATRVIYLGTDPALFALSMQPRDPNQLLHVGSTLERKGIDRILRLLAHLPGSVHLLQLGGVFTSQQQRLIAELNLGHRIVQRPATLMQLVHAYQTAAALVFPSRYEGYGLPCIEARLCGTNVFTSAAVPATEVLRQDPGTTILDVELLDEAVAVRGGAGELGRRLDEMAQQMMLRMGVQTPLANRQWYGWDRVAREHLDLYAGLGYQVQPRREVA